MKPKTKAIKSFAPAAQHFLNQLDPTLLGLVKAAFLEEKAAGDPVAPRSLELLKKQQRGKLTGSEALELSFVFLCVFFETVTVTRADNQRAAIDAAMKGTL